MKSRTLIILLCGILATVSLKSSDDTLSFNEDIRPILSDRCFKCHGPDADNQKSEFRLDTREHAIADLGDDFFGIVPGDIEASDLHWRIWDEEDEDRMPPPGSNLSLNEAEKKLLDRWIAEKRGGSELEIQLGSQRD